MRPFILSLAIGSAALLNIVNAIGAECAGEDTTIRGKNVLPAYFSADDDAEPIILCSPDFGVTPGTGNDITPALNLLIEEASRRYITDEPVVIYMPSGTYNIEGRIIPRSGVRLVGSNKEGATILESKNGAEIETGGDWYTPLDNFQFEQLYLKNVRASFGGGRKTRIASILNVFFDTKSRDAQLHIEHNNKHVVGNVFLRSKEFPGVGLTTYATKSSTAVGNLFGNAIFIGVDSLYSGDSNHYNEIAGAMALYKVYSAADASRTAQLRYFFDYHLADSGGIHVLSELRRKPQGNFTMAWFSNMDDGFLFSSNVIENDGEKGAFNPNTESRDLDNSMLITLRHHKNIVFEKNYIGSRNSAGANVVPRNGDKLSINLNHFRNVDLLLRAWEGEDYALSNYFIQGNRFSSAAKINFYDSGKNVIPETVALSYNIFEEPSNKTNLITGSSKGTLYCTTVTDTPTNTSTIPGSDGAYQFGRIPDDGATSAATIPCAQGFSKIDREQIHGLFSSWAEPISYLIRKDYIGHRFTNIGLWPDFLENNDI